MFPDTNPSNYTIAGRRRGGFIRCYIQWNVLSLKVKLNLSICEIGRHCSCTILKADCWSVFFKIPVVTGILSIDNVMVTIASALNMLPIQVKKKHFMNIK